MKYPSPFRYVGRLIKLVVIGSVVVTPSAAAPPARDDALQHELAWMSVRKGLAGTSETAHLPVDVRRLVEQGAGDDLELRVRASYRDIDPDAIAELDALWMDNLVDLGAGADAMDTFLEARAGMLSDMAGSEEAGLDNADKWRSFLRVFKRAPYDAGG